MRAMQECLYGRSGSGNGVFYSHQSATYHTTFIHTPHIFPFYLLSNSHKTAKNSTLLSYFSSYYLTHFSLSCSNIPSHSLFLFHSCLINSFVCFPPSLPKAAAPLLLPLLLLPLLDASSSRACCPSPLVNRRAPGWDRSPRQPG